MTVLREGRCFLLCLAFLGVPFYSSFARLESWVMKARHKNLGTKHQKVNSSVTIIPVWFWA